MIINGRRISNGIAEGRLLKSDTPISLLGGISDKGRVVDNKSSAFGKLIKGKIFAIPFGKGSTVGSYVLYSLKLRGLHPKAIVCTKADVIVATGAIISSIPMVDSIDLSILNNGDYVIVNGTQGTVEVKKNGR